MIPVVDGRALNAIVEDVELAAGVGPRNGYGGLVPAHGGFGPLDQHFLGGSGEKVPLLGCTCGEWGCWPLMARIAIEGDLVRWTQIAQPHRPERRYERIESFAFALVQYRGALSDLLNAL